MSDRKRIPLERESVTHRFSIGGFRCYITVGLYPDRRPGEVFLRAAKAGSTISGLMDSIALLISLSLQYGVPVEDICRILRHQRFEPLGIVDGIAEVTAAASLIDYVAAYLSFRHGTGEAAGMPRDRTLTETGTS